MKLSIKILILLLITTSCSFFTKQIQLKSYVLVKSSNKIVPKETISPEGNIIQYVDTISEREINGFAFLSARGVNITIDTIEKTIYIPPLGDAYLMLSSISKEDMTFIDKNSDDVNLTILSWEKTQKELVLQTQYNGMDFKCFLVDSLFSIRMDNGDMFLFLCDEKAKESAREINGNQL